jgi:hypothetical protein
MKYKILPFILLFAFTIIGCEEDKAEEEETYLVDSLSIETPAPDSAGTSEIKIEKSFSTAPKKRTAKELERIVDDTGFRLEEMKGSIAETEATLKKLNKKKPSPKEQAEKEKLGKYLSELNISLSRMQKKLSMQMQELEEARGKK